ncbi:FAD-dependent oxidoreductase [Gorillibacterium sp. sgz5001074]|uniref:FAD-dependent oxidoreductase n=1 Tax=Gorillibacterium sp. sgz5001074 TaxID=3446695 RepID=UPI003F66D306
MNHKSKLILGLASAVALAGLAGAAIWLKRDASGAEEPSSSSPVSVTAAATGTPKPSPKPTEPPIPTETVDIAVVGSELEGLYLARAAADEGLTVKIIDPREKVGGQLLQAEMLFLDETRDAQGKLMVQGRAKELFDGFRSGKIRKLSEFTAYFDTLRHGIPLESGVTLGNVETGPGLAGSEAVHSVLYQTKDGAKKRLSAAYWVENTDFAALAGKLKATRLPGLEKFYGQDHIEYMSSGMMMKFKGVDWARFQEHYKESVNASYAIGLTSVTNGYKPTNSRVFLRGLNAVNQRDGEVLINAFLIYTVDPANDTSVREAMELGKKELPLILDYFRKHMTGWEKAELNGFPNYLYIREYNHYETDYVLKVSDMLGARMFPDNVSIAGYPLDLQGTSANKWGIEMGRPDKYGMPLRSFQLKNYENVLLAGKNVGSSAIAYGSARIQPNTSLAAESIGVILGQIKGKKKLRELTAQDWSTLHPYLESKYGIKLTGVTGTNKLAGWTEEELRKLDTGEIVYPTYVKTRKP